MRVSVPVLPILPGLRPTNPKRRVLRPARCLRLLYLLGLESRPTPMHPVLTVLEWGGVTRPIGSYGASLALALLTGAALTLRSAARAGLDTGAMISVLSGAIGFGFVCAYLASALVLWAELGSLSAAIVQPGIMFYGGAIGGALGFAGLSGAFGLPVAAAFDTTLPALPIAHAIGRLGCFFGGCCFGAPSTLPWAIVYDHPLAPAAHPALSRHPWPLYEAACLLALAALFASPKFFAGRPGRRAALYVALYAAVRCTLEPLRGDAVRGVFLHGCCSVAQLISLATGAAAVVFLYQQMRRPLCASSLQV
jgi:phosphatidylglycerol:prolipoprotein diacylglycerol transferase